MPTSTQTLHAGALYVQLQRLSTTGRVLYVAAHPDDENTHLLAYLANHRYFDTAYLSITRGGGGQNLVGAEQSALLGVIRTQELLAARGIDGGRQFFTNARDFGYSKNAEEALRLWGHEATLAEVVWVIRTFLPDVIITRFPEEGRTHGHHTASSRLAREAFAAAADPTRFADQLQKGARVWQAQRLLFNVPQWGNEKGNSPPFMGLDVGGYSAQLGLSYGELAAESRSMHRSQGFGSAGRRGSKMEYFEYVSGTKPKTAPFDSLELGWERLPQGDTIARSLQQAVARFDVERPERMLAALLSTADHIAWAEMKNPDLRLREKREALSEVIAAVLGLYVEAVAERPSATPKGRVKIALDVLKRRPGQVKLLEVRWPHHRQKLEQVLETDVAVHLTEEWRLPKDTAYSIPYWLTQEPSKARYRIPAAASEAAGRGAEHVARLAQGDVGDSRSVTSVVPALEVGAQPVDQLGAPEGTPALSVSVVFNIEGRVLHYKRPVVYRWTDRVQGERRKRFLVLPQAMLTPLERNVMFVNGATRVVSFRAEAGRDAVAGKVRLKLPTGWKVAPDYQSLSLVHAGDQQHLAFEITPPANANVAVEVAPMLEVDGIESGYRFDTIDYTHIPVQGVLRAAQIRLVPMRLSVPTGLVGYIAGSGDMVAESLRQVGMNVEELDEDTLQSVDLSRFAAIVLGIRAYNTQKWLTQAQPLLMEWVQRGGTLVTQYNVNTRWSPLEQQLGPYPFSIGRGRVTDESASMQVIDPQNTILHIPNKLSEDDFQGWVQERGLYFAATWDKKYHPVFRMNDKGEAPLEGALLHASYGKGTFIYTGISFFRQLPAGIPGAYRLFANIIGHSRSGSDYIKPVSRE